MKKLDDLSLFIEAVASAGGLQCGVVGTDGVAVLGTGAYKSNVGTRRPRGCYFTRSGTEPKTHLIRHPMDASECAHCEAKERCIYASVLCIPIVKGGEALGKAGLFAKDGEAAEKLLRDRTFWYEYLENVARSLARASSMSAVLEMRNLSEEMLNRFFNVPHPHGLILAGADDSILRLNENARDMFHYYEGAVDFGDPLSKILPEPVWQQLKLSGLRYGGQTSFERDRHEYTLRRLDSGYLHEHGLTALVIQEQGRGRAVGVSLPPPEKGGVLDRIIGGAGAIIAVKKTVLRVAAHDLPVLIQGESGTGKELIAEAIHANSGRQGKRMVAFNCSAIPDTLLESELFGYEKGAFSGASSAGKKGLFELANGSTIFLDEVGDMSLTGQAKLLRLLEQRQLYRLGGQQPIGIDVRVVAATNAPLKAWMEAGRFRSDLYYRLNAVPILLPPLRERKEDILLLAAYFLQLAGQGERRLSGEARALLTAYRWPGNIRELRNVIGYMLAVTDEDPLPARALPPYLPLELSGAAAPAPSPGRSRPGRDEILAALDRCGRDTRGKEQAAVQLRISLATLYRLIKKYAII